jgi:hypothetical protein
MSKRKIEKCLKTVTYTVIVCARRRSIFSAVLQARCQHLKCHNPSPVAEKGTCTKVHVCWSTSRFWTMESLPVLQKKSQNGFLVAGLLNLASNLLRFITAQTKWCCGRWYREGRVIGNWANRTGESLASVGHSSLCERSHVSDQTALGDFFWQNYNRVIRCN